MRRDQNEQSNLHLAVGRSWHDSDGTLAPDYNSVFVGLIGTETLTDQVSSHLASTASYYLAELLETLKEIIWCSKPNE